jgi:hypothetical protein
VTGCQNNLEVGDPVTGKNVHNVTMNGAAARLRLQKIGEAGKGSSECICFPEDEQPFFQTSEESDLAAGVQCPLHGKRFTPRFHIYVAAWRWKNEVKFQWPRLSAQYHKAWAASFPPDR